MKSFRFSVLCLFSLLLAPLSADASDWIGEVHSSLQVYTATTWRIHPSDSVRDNCIVLQMWEDRAGIRRGYLDWLGTVEGGMRGTELLAVVDEIAQREGLATVVLEDQSRIEKANSRGFSLHLWSVMTSAEGKSWYGRHGWELLTLKDKAIYIGLLDEDEIVVSPELYAAAARVLKETTVGDLFAHQAALPNVELLDDYPEVTAEMSVGEALTHLKENQEAFDTLALDILNDNSLDSVEQNYINSLSKGVIEGSLIETLTMLGALAKDGNTSEIFDEVMRKLNIDEWRSVATLEEANLLETLVKYDTIGEALDSEDFSDLIFDLYTVLAARGESFDECLEWLQSETSSPDEQYRKFRIAQSIIRSAAYFVKSYGNASSRG